MDKRRFAGFRWPGSTRVVVFGQGLAIIIWPSESGDHESGNQALCDSLGFVVVDADFGEAVTQCVAQEAERQSFQPDETWCGFS